MTLIDILQHVAFIAFNPAAFYSQAATSLSSRHVDKIIANNHWMHCLQITAEDKKNRASLLIVLFFHQNRQFAPSSAHDLIIWYRYQS